MNLSKRQERGGEPVQSSWNCYSPFVPYSELFLTQKISHSDTKVNKTSRECLKVRSDIVSTNRSKVSLKTNKQKLHLNQSGEIKSNLSGNVKKYNSSNYTSGEMAASFNQTDDFLFYNPQTPQYLRRDYGPQSPTIILSTPQQCCSPLPSPPVITFSHFSKEDDSKWIENDKKQEKNEQKINILKTQTTVGNSQSEQLDQSPQKKEKEKFSKGKTDFKATGLRSLELKKEKESQQNPEPEVSQKQKPGITKSLLHSHQFHFKGEEKLLGEPIRSFCSEKNVSTKRLQRMQEVQEIKSQPDSEENNESDAESIVLDRVDLTGSYNLNSLKGLNLPLPVHPSNSSIQFRDSQYV